MKEYIVSVADDDMDYEEVFIAYIREQTELIRCKDCKHFEADHFEVVNGLPLIVAHEICTRWGDGCKTSENGWCFMAKPEFTEAVRKQLDERAQRKEMERKK